MAKKRTQEEFIIDANIVHNNKYSYEKTIFTRLRDRIFITCPTHGEFDQIAGNHLRGRGCVKCANESVGGKLGLEFKNTFQELAQKLHNNKYEYDMSTFTYGRCKMNIICPVHGTFSQSPTAHLQGQGCRPCAIRDRCDARIAKARATFRTKANKIHGDTYGYDAVEYTNRLTPVAILCPVHGHFWQSPTVHLRGCGCPACTKYGYQYDKPALIYILITTGGFAGFGITGSLKSRLWAHTSNLKEHGIDILDIYIFSGFGRDVFNIEAYLKKTYTNVSVNIEGFKTEAFTNDRLPLVLDYLRSREDLK